jgi:hypothetical protein
MEEVKEVVEDVEEKKIEDSEKNKLKKEKSIAKTTFQINGKV